MTEIVHVNAVELEQFSQIKEEIAELSFKCNKAIINSPETLAYGKELAITAKKISKMIEDKRKEVTKPLVDKKKEFDDFAKDLTSELESSIKNLRTQIFVFEQEVERQRQEAVRKAEEERKRIADEIRKAEEERLKMAAEAKQQDEKAIREAEELRKKQLDEQRKLDIQQRDLVKQKSSNIRKVWTFDVVNPDLVPDQFWTINEQLLKQAVMAGVREIPGVNIYQKEELTLR